MTTAQKKDAARALALDPSVEAILSAHVGPAAREGGRWLCELRHEEFSDLEPLVVLSRIRWDAWPAFKGDFTIRSGRPGRTKNTELARVLRGEGSYLCYVHARSVDRVVLAWFLIDLCVFRRHFRAAGGTKMTNEDRSSAWRYYSFSDFPGELIRASHAPETALDRRRKRAEAKAAQEAAKLAQAAEYADLEALLEEAEASPTCAPITEPSLFDDLLAEADSAYVPLAQARRLLANLNSDSERNHQMGIETECDCHKLTGVPCPFWALDSDLMDLVPDLGLFFPACTRAHMRSGRIRPIMYQNGIYAYVTVEDLEDANVVTLRNVDVDGLAVLRSHSDWSTTNCQGRYEFHQGRDLIVAFEAREADPAVMSPAEVTEILGF